MTTPLADYYKMDRDSLPPEFSAPGAKIRLFLTGTVLPYRTAEGRTTVQRPEDFPVRRVIAVTVDGKTTYWTEDLEANRKFDSKSKWVELGVGVCRDGKFNKFLFYLAQGYLHGYPLRDVLYFATRFGLHSAAGQRILRREELRRSLGAEVLPMNHKARTANALYDERDT